MTKTGRYDPDGPEPRLPDPFRVPTRRPAEVVDFVVAIAFIVIVLVVLAVAILG